MFLHAVSVVNFLAQFVGSITADSVDAFTAHNAVNKRLFIRPADIVVGPIDAWDLLVV